MKKFIFISCFIILHLSVLAEDGYRLWLRYDKINNPTLLQHYTNSITSIHIYGSSPTLTVAKKEMENGLEGLLGKNIFYRNQVNSGSIIIFTKSSVPAFQISKKAGYENLGKEGFEIFTTTSGTKKITVITANHDVGLLYGVFHFLRLIQTQQNIQNLSVISIPKIQNRVLNHWDNLNRHVERGYAGISIWNWHTLPAYIDHRYIDYARANASIGINGTVLTNVNANALVLTKEYLIKVAALANAFRPYGIKVFLTARFSAPLEIGGLKTADPLDADVKKWWNEKTKEIYQYIPDFGGFLVKANSEGQPGPQNYNRTHADGANMLADAIAPFGGIIMWRAFVYTNENPEDRFKQAYSEFKPLDGSFKKNVLIQVKNGPLDFQPREPYSPLFRAMPQTPLMMEFQITQEYLGQGTHLVYEVPMFKEVLNADTHANGKGSFVSKVINGSLHNYSITGIAGVSNIGNERNWTHHPFAQSNWYAFGRLAWNHNLSSETIADEWLKQTFKNNKKFIDTAKEIMLSSYKAMVNYMTPLGLHHIMGTGHHFGPAPWVNDAGRDDWNPVYYHRADEKGLGFDRTATGSNALAQYATEVRAQWENIETCPEEYLLWFHHVQWTHKMKSGRTLWEELCFKYYSGVDNIKAIQNKWNSLSGLIDEERFKQVQMLLNIQVEEAVWWRNACLLYFQTFSKMAIPENYEQPTETLEYYKSLKFPYAPGNT
jgi:alpha-glucuronidase